MRLLAEIPPRSYEESAMVLDWMEEHAEAFGSEEDRAIFKNILNHPGCKASQLQGREAVVEYQCACGDIYQGTSFGAGYMAANNGVCENCDVAVDGKARHEMALNENVARKDWR